MNDAATDDRRLSKTTVFLRHCDGIKDTCPAGKVACPLAEVLLLVSVSVTTQVILLMGEIDRSRASTS